ncbi:MAG: hypothetical protein ACFFC7_16295 [Candidatus Hermodarchaeota archaeon]
MLEIIDALKKGFNLWKQAWLTQLIAILVLSFISGFIVVPFAFLVAIATEIFGTPEVITQPNTLLTFSVFQSILEYPLVWLVVFLLLVVFMITNTVTIAAIQRVGHDYAQTGTGRFEETIKILIPMIIPLSIVAIVSSIITVIPLLIFAEIFNLLRDTIPTGLPTILSLPFIVGSTLDLDIIATVSLLIFALIFVLLSGPPFLATSGIVTEEADMNGIIEGWKLYFRKPLSTIVAMIVYLIIGILIVSGFFLLVNGLIILLGITTDVIAIVTFSLGWVFALLVYFVIILFAINPWFYTVMYSFYQEIKE